MFTTTHRYLNETKPFNIEEFHSDNSELSAIIEYTKETKNKELLNLCKKMFYSIQNGISIEEDLSCAKEIIIKIKTDELQKQYQEVIASIKEKELKLRKAIDRQNKLSEELNKLTESHQNDEEYFDKLQKYLKTKEELNKTNILLEADILDDEVADFSDNVVNQEEDKTDDLNLPLLDDNLTKDFIGFEKNELDNNTIKLKYQLNDDTSYISIVNTDLNLLVTDINKIFADAIKIEKSSINKKETINLIEDVLNDIKGYYRYKEYVRYYYNSFKNNLDKALDYEQHIELLSDLTNKMKDILENIFYYLGINNISFKDLNEHYRLSEHEYTIIQKIMNSPEQEPITTKDVLYSMPEKKLLDTIDTKTLK